MSSPRHRRIAVLGGGLGALTAAFQLTETPGWDQEFEITVYQRGWRLGGKASSGRNMAADGRIEQNGIHLWGGYYDNAFRVLEAAYKAAERPANCPIGSVRDAFTPLSSIYLAPPDGDQANIFRLDFPRNDQKPGTNGVSQHVGTYFVELLKGLQELLQHIERDAPSLDHVLADVPRDQIKTANSVPATHRRSLLLTARYAARKMLVAAPGGSHSGFVVWLLDRTLDWLSDIGQETDLDPTERALVAALLIGTACAKGMVQDGILTYGFDCIDDAEWSTWCRGQGAPEWAMHSSIVRAAYESLFAYRGGKPSFENRNISAGVALRLMLRLLFTYKGSIFYKPNGGIGDVAVAPLYQALVKRGVRFEFFSTVTHLGLDDRKRYVQRIEIERQVTLKDPSDGYQPFVEIKGLPCWPSEPLYDQLVQGQELKASGADLESIWSGWTAVEKETLHRDTDFDLVILGIPPAALPLIATELMQAQPEWATMCDQVTSVPTQSIQFWLNKSAKALHGPGSDPGAVLGAFAQPFSTWSDMSTLLNRESWPKDGPRQLSYLSAILPETVGMPPPGASPYPQELRVAMETAAMAWVGSELPKILPGTGTKGGSFDPTVLYGGVEGQYFQVGVQPSDRFVQSPPGSSKTRLAAGDGRFVNLFNAGDWLRTGLNAGCAEAAAMGGLQAAQAISGVDVGIVGEADFSVSPLAAVNAPFPWNRLYADGWVDGIVITFSAPVSQVEAMIPSELKLMPQSTFPDGHHLISVILTDQKNVGINLMRNWGMTYQECVFAVPYLTFRDATSGPPGPFMYFPQLNLNAVGPIILGRLFYAFNKKLSRITGNLRQCRVATLLDDSEILKADLRPYGPRGHYYDFDNVMGFLPLIRQPILGRTIFGGWICSYLSYQIETGHMQAIEGSISFNAGHLGFEEPKTYEIESIYESPTGAFEFSGKWTLTNPFQSSGLKRYLKKIRADQQG